MRPLLRVLLVIAVSWTATARPAVDAQVRPVYDLGAAGLVQALERLQTTASALHTGAHPDDEDSGFMARTARGDHARVAYLSLTRGEGGQNFLGTELFDALGVIRSEELLQARALDGGDQFFTRAIDFGFSKTRAEAAAVWNEHEVLDDMVRVIRAFRPLVVVSRFSGTPADGHGHHQLAGHLTPLAVDAAARADQFTHHFADGLRPWRTRKVYRSLRRPEPGLLEVPTGTLDPVLGRTYAEIAAEGRSQHKSQEMGSLERRGGAWSYLERVDGPWAAGERSIFDGIDVSVRGLAALAGLPGGALQEELDDVADHAEEALADYDPRAPAGIVTALAGGLRATRAARSAVAALAAPQAARAEADFLLAIKEAQFTDALARASGLVIDALADREMIPQGSTVTMTIRAFYPDRDAVRILDSGLSVPDGWTVALRADEGADDPRSAERAEYAQAFSVSVPDDARLTQPYFLAVPPDGARYRWTEDAPRGDAFDAGPAIGWVTFEAGGVAATVRTRVDFRFADRVRGEVRRNVNVVPAITLSVDSPLLIVPVGSSPSRHAVVVAATSHSERPTTAALRLRLPEGWRSVPAEATVMFASAGERRAAAFTIEAPAGRTPAKVTIGVEATAAGRTYGSDVQTIAYPHIETHRLYRPADITTQVLDLQVAPVRVGYVMGSGDRVPEALARMGVDVVMLDDETLARGDLSRFDTIVVGVRASEARPDFAAEHARLLEYVRGGGTLVVQYQQTDYLARNLPPYPVPPQGNSRVTNEAAPVRLLAPDHPVFTFPNRITEADFDGWVQERNLYAFPTVEPGYTPLLETADPGEDPQRGGQVYAEIGKGRYLYTAYSWFRQLPAGVPGAYRQFANLISLSRAPR